MQTKGIILAAGRGTRLYPITKSVSKQLLPVYDKPMIYYPLSILMLAGIRDIMLVINEKDHRAFFDLLGDGSHLGIRISYGFQDQPKGLAHALLVAKDFIGQNRCCVTLGDNVFYGDALPRMIKKALQQEGASVFCYAVNDPSRYGVATLDKNGSVKNVVEKPSKTNSPWAITGLYCFDQNVIKYATQIKPSQRGEFEITAVLKKYLVSKKLSPVLLGRGFAWLDTGTFDSLIEASGFIKTIETRQGLKIGCLEEIAYRLGYISLTQLKVLAKGVSDDDAIYLKKVAQA